MRLRVAMQSLPDGARCPGSVVLGMPASQIEVRITNGNCQRLAQPPAWTSMSGIG